MGYQPKAPTDEDFLMLRCVTDEFQRSREIAARYYGTTVEEATNSNRSVEVSRAMRRLVTYGYVERDYTPSGGLACLFALTDAGRDYLASESQAA